MLGHHKPPERTKSIFLCCDFPLIYSGLFFNLSQEVGSGKKTQDAPLLSLGLQRAVLFFFLHQSQFYLLCFIRFNASCARNAAGLGGAHINNETFLSHHITNIQLTVMFIIGNGGVLCTWKKASEYPLCPFFQDMPDSNSYYNTLWLLVIKAKQDVPMFYNRR